MRQVGATTGLFESHRAFLQRPRRGEPVTLNTVRVPKLKAQVSVPPSRPELTRMTLEVHSQVDPRGQIVDLTA